MQKSAYTFAEYDPAWPEEAWEEKKRLQSLFGSVIVETHHIGSTSVPGLAAKPIIDLIPVVHDIQSIAASTRVLTEGGYRAWGEYGLPGRQFFTKDRNGWRTHNIHFYQEGNAEIERHVAFAAYLRAHPEARRAYEAVKRAAFAAHPANIDAYNGAKQEWIRETERRAIHWFRLASAPPPAESQP